MKTLLLVACLAVLPACGLVEKIEAFHDDVIAQLETVKAKVEQAKVIVREADTDGDGTLSISEIGAMLAALVALLGAGKAVAVGKASTKATDELFDLHVANATKIAAVDGGKP